MDPEKFPGASRRVLYIVSFVFYSIIGRGTVILSITVQASYRNRRKPYKTNGSSDARGIAKTLINHCKNSFLRRRCNKNGGSTRSLELVR